MDPTQSAGRDPQDVRTDGKAIWSLVLGILSITCFWILTGIPAIILGHISRSNIRKSMGRLQGEGMALAGLVLGYISVALLPIALILASIAIPSLLRARQVANESAAVANLRSINTAEVSYRSAESKYGDLDALIAARLLDESMRGTIANYNYSLVADPMSFTATAMPATENSGRFAFTVSEDGVIRYSSDGTLAPPGQTGLPVR